MVARKKSAPAAQASRQADAGRAAPAAAAKLATAARKVRAAQFVSRVSAGGYTVCGSPVQPKHRTSNQIAQAIAELD